jgi:hypothetical protein
MGEMPTNEELERPVLVTLGSERAKRAISLQMKTIIIMMMMMMTTTTMMCFLTGCYFFTSE